MSPEIPLSPDVIANELVIVPASLELITTDGVVVFDGVLTTVCSLSVGAAKLKSLLKEETGQEIIREVLFTKYLYH